jgi:FlaA1/EpsC-like NDP-sugar epimerase
MTAFDRLVQKTVELPRSTKKGIAIGLDAALCVLTVWIAFYIRVGERAVLPGYQWPAVAASVALALPIFVTAGLYRSVFRYVGWEALAAMSQAVAAYGIVFAGVFTAIGVPGVPRSIGLIQPVLLFLAVGASRAFARYWLGGRYRQRLRGPQSNALIYGAGSAGRQLALALAEAPGTRVVAFIDDDQHVHNSLIAGIKVWESHRLAELVERHGVTEIFLAMPSAPRWRRNEILKLIQPVGVAVRTLPGLLDLAHGRVTVSDLRPLEVDDLLGREPVAPDLALLERDIRDCVVLVTGAGGSIGSELCRQILTLRPATLLLVETSEYALYAIHRDLERLEAGSEGGVRLVPLLGSVCDEARMQAIFSAWRPHSVYHAAAYKHVPLVEHNPVEGIGNNVFGTLITARMAQQFGAARFVLISTDKAVRPTNVMGASKRIAEMILQAMGAERAGTCFSMVRFGNVLGSSGSVVPLFRQQVAAGGPVTVTDPDVTRYFMTIPEAAQLVLHAGAMATGGEVFVLDMGEPVRIMDLAIRIIELSGYKARHAGEPQGEIEIVFTGLRPGEKLYEELLIGNNPAPTSHSRIMMASESFLPLSALNRQLGLLGKAIRARDVGRLRILIGDLVPEYAPAGDVVDWIHLEEMTGPGDSVDSAGAGRDQLVNCPLGVTAGDAGHARPATGKPVVVDTKPR